MDLLRIIVTVPVRYRYTLLLRIVLVVSFDRLTSGV